MRAFARVALVAVLLAGCGVCRRMWRAPGRAGTGRPGTLRAGRTGFHRAATGCRVQLHGAGRAARSRADARGAVGDNPLVFVGDREILSGGNFHGAPIGLPMDALSVALTAVGALSQRRTNQMINNSHLFDLPPRLSAHPQHQVGLQLISTAAASLVSECATLCNPATVTSIGADDIEDHVSMAAHAARQAHRVSVNLRRVLALELVAAAQALDFRCPAKASAPTQRLHGQVRSRLRFIDRDTPLHLESVEDLLVSAGQP